MDLGALFRVSSNISMYWPAKSSTDVNNEVLKALSKNKNYKSVSVIGVPGTHLDQVVFPQSEIPDDAAYLHTFFDNPNHIGVHTGDTSEIFFRGTHELERDMLRICAEEIFCADKNSYDGYMATGGTEANIQAMWIARNYYMKEFDAKIDEIAIIHSSDTHYSCYKSGNLLLIENIEVPVNQETRQIILEEFEVSIIQAKEKGVKYFLLILNMGTTMFGSVDSDGPLVEILKKQSVEFYIHVDAAFGGFIYPITTKTSLNFLNPNISSITIDAHKMLQAPYGSGIFLCKKNFLKYTETENAKYVEGLDSTLCGSRSGANAVATWMILNSYGSEGAVDFCDSLVERTHYLTAGLDELNIKYFYENGMNIVTMVADQVPHSIVELFGLVPDSHEKAKWVKIVVMDHVTLEKLSFFLESLKEELLQVSK